MGQNQPETLPSMLIFYGLCFAGIGTWVLLTDADARVALIPAGLLAALVGHRWLRRVRSTGIRLDPEGVRLRNIFSNRLIPWESVEAFTFLPGQSRMIIRAKGGPFPVTGIRAAKLDDRIRGLVDQFNASLERRTGRRADPRWTDPPPAARMPAVLFQDVEIRSSPLVLALAITMVIAGLPLAVGLALAAPASPIGTAAMLVGTLGVPLIAFIRSGPRYVLAHPSTSLRLLLVPFWIIAADCLFLPIPQATVQTIALVIVALIGLALALRVSPGRQSSS